MRMHLTHADAAIDAVVREYAALSAAAQSGRDLRAAWEQHIRDEVSAARLARRQQQQLLQQDVVNGVGGGDDDDECDKEEYGDADMNDGASPSSFFVPPDNSAPLQQQQQQQRHLALQLELRPQRQQVLRDYDFRASGPLFRRNPRAVRTRTTAVVVAAAPATKRTGGGGGRASSSSSSSAASSSSASAAGTGGGGGAARLGQQSQLSPADIAVTLPARNNRQVSALRARLPILASHCYFSDLAS